MPEEPSRFDAYPEDKKEELKKNPVKFKSKKVFKKKKSVESVKFPLDKDSKASFTQYIFENTDELLNIFNYKRSQKSVEITILNNDDIFSVNYHSLGKSRFTLVGKPYPKKMRESFLFIAK